MLITSEKNGHVLTFDDVKHRYTLDTRSVPGATTFGKGGYPTSEALVNWKIKHSMLAAIEATWDTVGEWLNSGKEKLNFTDKLKDEIRQKAKQRPEDLAIEAADIGTLVHDYANHYEAGRTLEAAKVMNTINNHPDKDTVHVALDKFLDWNSRNRDELIASEEVVALPCINHLTQEDDCSYTVSGITIAGENRGLCTCYAGKFDVLRRRGGRNILSDFKTSTGIYVDMFIQLGAYKPAIEYWLGYPIHGLEILRFGKEKGKEFETRLITDPDEIAAFQRQALLCRETYAFKRVWDVDERFKWLGPTKKKTPKLRKRTKKDETTGDVEPNSSGGETTAGTVASVHTDEANGTGVDGMGEVIS